MGSNPTPGVLVIKMTDEEIILKVADEYGLIGRREELIDAWHMVQTGKHILLEGPVGVGKTLFAKVLASSFSNGFIRVDGDERLTENKLVGHWDPPMVLTKGYIRDSFVTGPLVRAMESGALLFINELNRLPESTQNVLLPVMDEDNLFVPKLGFIKAKSGFVIVATQNPEENIGVTGLSEALRDRFLLIRLEYPSKEEEIRIARLRSGINDDSIIETAVKIVRLTRTNKKLRRGGSIRCSIDLSLIASNYSPMTPEKWVKAALLVLSSRIEPIGEYRGNVNQIIEEVVLEALGFQELRAV